MPFWELSICNSRLCYIITFFGFGLLTIVLFYAHDGRDEKAPIRENAHAGQASNSQKQTIDVSWRPPSQTSINNLTAVVHETGVYDFVFNDSHTPLSRPYSTYNWCNMPHIRAQEYIKAPDDYRLRYVEVIHRHHKRTPYASNTFPQETHPWYCDDEALFAYGAPQPENSAAAIKWQVYSSPSNPFRSMGFDGTCQFPQITAAGLIDSRQHGKDLFGVYHDLLSFLPDEFDTSKISLRVTNNQITSQVIGQVIVGMYPLQNHVATQVHVQPSSIDSLEPRYACPAALSLYSAYGVGSQNQAWLNHLTQSTQLFSKLDGVSNVNTSDKEWHDWFDHYFDNLSARLCHQKPLPCSVHDSKSCITQDDADAVFRRGEHEYSYIYRDASRSLRASVMSYGVWMAELAANMRNSMTGQDEIIYRHNVAHDGSISRLLSILQVDVMVWPGMGSEVAFELYEKEGRWYTRVLWSGQILKSSSPRLGRADLIPVEALLTYIDDLVGVDAEEIQALCTSMDENEDQ